MNPETQDALKQISKGAKPSELESETLDFKQDAPTLSDTMGLLARAAIGPSRSSTRPAPWSWNRRAASSAGSPRATS